MRKTCFIVAGPNGAGKTTFAESYLPAEAGCYNFINADLIAQGVSPLRPESAGIEAGRILFRKMGEFVEKEESFGFESTLSGQGYVSRIRHMKVKGYRIVIFYLRLASPELAMSRVTARVAEGGHKVRDDDLVRRFGRSWTNFTEIYRPLSDEWIVFDNSGFEPIVLERSS